MSKKCNSQGTINIYWIISCFLHYFPTLLTIVTVVLYFVFVLNYCLAKKLVICDCFNFRGWVSISISYIPSFINCTSSLRLTKLRWQFVIRLYFVICPQIQNFPNFWFLTAYIVHQPATFQKDYLPPNLCPQMLVKSFYQRLKWNMPLLIAVLCYRSAYFVPPGYVYCSCR